MITGYNTLDTAESQNSTVNGEAEGAYRTSLEHLTDELKRLDLLLRLCITGEEQPDAISPFGGMVLTTGEILELLDAGRTEEYDKRQLWDKIAEMNALISKRREASKLKGIRLSLPHISEMLNLSPFEEFCIIICLAPELDRKYEKIYAYFQNDMTMKSPSIHFVLQFLTNSDEERIAARKFFDLQAPLMKFLMEHHNDATDYNIPLIARTLKLDDWVVNFLLEVHVLDSRLMQTAQLIPVSTQAADSILTAEDKNIIRFIKHYQDSKEGRKQLFYLYGPEGSGKYEHVLTVCNSLSQSMIVADIAKILASEMPFDEILRLLGRQLMLEGSVLCLENFDLLLIEDERKQHKLNCLIQMLSAYAPISFILGKKQWSTSAIDTNFTFVGIEFPFPTESERKAYWNKFSQNHKLAQTVDLENLAGNFSFTQKQIYNALNIGENLSVWNGAVDGQIGEEELYNACYYQSNRKLSTLAARINKIYKWDMLVLPADQTSQLEEICSQVKNRALVYEKWGFNRRLSLGKGLNVLFSGPPGSGKTMAAEVIANEIGLEIYKIDVSQVVSKYIGETEKNLEVIFTEAETSNAILFFDEADALFGKRSDVKDAHDRYANVEISYLLQRMEEYKGIVILATNLNQNIDEAFLRRLNFNVAFPFPEKEQRKLIWKGIFPSGAPLDSNLDYDFLADKFILAGGNIKNIALNAAFYAAHASCSIGMKQIMLAAKREYKKMGKTFLKSDFDPYYQLIEVVK